MHFGLRAGGGVRAAPCLNPRRLAPTQGVPKGLSLLIGKLLGNPVVSVASAARLTGRSQEAARLAIHSLEGAGILVQNAKNRKSGIYVAREVVDAFTEYERALATPGGDTAAAQPARPVPPRVPRERR